MQEDIKLALIDRINFLLADPSVVERTGDKAFIGFTAAELTDDTMGLGLEQGLTKACVILGAFASDSFLAFSTGVDGLEPLLLRLFYFFISFLEFNILLGFA